MLARAMQIYGSGAAPPTDARAPPSASFVDGSIAATIRAVAVALIFGLSVVIGLVALFRRRSA